MRPIELSLTDRHTTSLGLLFVTVSEEYSRNLVVQVKPILDALEKISCLDVPREYPIGALYVQENMSLITT